MIQYKLLSKFICEHAYFNKNQMEYLNFVPSQESNRALRQAKMAFRNNSSGFELYFSNETADIITTSGLDAKFVFHIEVTNPIFYNITSLPNYNGVQNILKFSNDRISDASGDSVLLHEEDIVGSEDYTSRSDFPEIDNSILGVIELSIDGSKLGQEEVNETIYNIRFDSIKVKIKYSIIANQNEGEFEIDSSNGALQFESPVPTTLANGANAILIASIQPVELLQHYDYHCILKSTDSDLLEIRLPHVDPNAIRIDQHGNIYADVFVYV